MAPLAHGGGDRRRGRLGAFCFLPRGGLVAEWGEVRYYIGRLESLPEGRQLLLKECFMAQASEELALGIAQALYDKQAEQIRVLDVRGVSTVTDYCVVATGTSSPHLKALQKAAQAYLKSQQETTYRGSGEADSGWVLLDAFTVVVHLFVPEARAYYDIEALWKGAKELPFTPAP